MAGRRRRRRRIYFVFNDTIEGSPGRWAVGPLRSRPRVRERLRIREREFVGDLAQTGSMASSSDRFRIKKKKADTSMGIQEFPLLLLLCKL